jgi:hypothetical protein
VSRLLCCATVEAGVNHIDTSAYYGPHDTPFHPGVASFTLAAVVPACDVRLQPVPRPERHDVRGRDV